MVSICRYSLLVALCLIAHPATAQTITGIVVGIADGDTLTLLDAGRKQHKIRLKGIDAPESHQPFGQKSKHSLSAMVFNREVEIQGSKRDRYGRTLGKVMAADPNCNAPACPKIHDVNLMQVSAGMAWWYRQYAREQSPQEREDYEVAEFQAKSQRRGLWADKSPVPPWEWRRR